MQKLEEVQDAGSAEVLQLLEQRDTLEEWLSRLDEHRGDVNDRVLEKVRQDYETRLQETLSALAEHRQALQGELDRTTRRLIEAENARQEASDELEETRLRTLIGEVDGSVWKEREPELNAALSAARETEKSIRAESERLRDLLDQLDERETEDAAPLAFELGSQELDLPAAGDVATIENPVAAVEDASEVDNGPVAEAVAEVVSPIESVDIASAGLASEEPVAIPASGDETAEGDGEEVDTAPKPGLKCGECGYTNDLSAWFCGVCGADVG